MPRLPIIGYLAICTVVGIMTGRAFGAFGRAGFHFPPSPADVSPWHRAVLEALDVVEWPALFGLTLAWSLALWTSIGPRTSARGATWQTSGILVAVASAAGAIVCGGAADTPGRSLAALVGAALGALAASLALTFWREAASEAQPIRERWLRQLRPAAGHLVTTSAAALSLGYRGENSLIQGIMLLVGFGIFGVELGLALAFAILAPVAEGMQRTARGRRIP